MSLGRTTSQSQFKGSTVKVLLPGMQLKCIHHFCTMASTFYFPVSVCVQFSDILLYAVKKTTLNGNQLVAQGILPLLGLTVSLCVCVYGSIGCHPYVRVGGGCAGGNTSAAFFQDSH